MCVSLPLTVASRTWFGVLYIPHRAPTTPFLHLISLSSHGPPVSLPLSAPPPLSSPLCCFCSLPAISATVFFCVLFGSTSALLFLCGWGFSSLATGDIRRYSFRHFLPVYKLKSATSLGFLLNLSSSLFLSPRQSLFSLESLPSSLSVNGVVALAAAVVVCLYHTIPRASSRFILFFRQQKLNVNSHGGSHPIWYRCSLPPLLWCHPSSDQKSLCFSLVAMCRLQSSSSSFPREATGLIIASSTARRHPHRLIV